MEKKNNTYVQLFFNSNNSRYLNRVTPSVTGLVSTGALYNIKQKQDINVMFKMLESLKNVISF